MEKRLLAALALSFLVIVAWQAMFAPAPAPRRGAPLRAAPPPAARRPPAPPAPAPAAVQAFPERKSVLKNEFLALEFTSLGAGVRKVELLDYWTNAAHRKARDPAHQLVLFDLPASAPPVGALALDRANGGDLERAGWEVIKEEPRAVAYRLEAGGTRVEKEFTLPAHARHVRVTVRIAGAPAAYRIAGGFALKEELEITAGAQEVVGHYGTITESGAVHVVSVPIAGKTMNPAPARGIVWGAVSSRFFTLVLRGLPSQGGLRAEFLSEGRFEIVPDIDPDRTAAALAGYAFSKGKAPAALTAAERTEALAKLPRTGRPVLVAREAADAAHQYEIFLGPKDPVILDAYKGLNYRGIIDYGYWTGWLVTFFLVVLKGLFAVVRDYGIAILILTLLVKACLHPLNRKNQKAMQGYQAKIAKIQPELDLLKERYKNNRRKLHQEMQKTMHAHGVNPNEMLGGCLLMFLQLPVWIALIQVFRVAIELRQTPALFGLIGDLTLPDRTFRLGFQVPLLGWEYFNTLPILYVLLTIVQQRMMPAAKDAQARQQQKMMGLMMIFFGFIFYNFSAGLLLYFLMSAGLGIIEQRIIRRELAAESAAMPVKS
ncbi:MAG TPA: membrane protein insertase YidC [Planctomycetota bacterium]|jgi:YidC/Oxa1 family membrane protein insertase|nr:membrane protein insertase YidC [Planctomycetota bacterium]